jgi:hypothetical protein
MFAAGATAGVVYVAEDTPALLVSPAPVGSVPVTRRDFDDVRTVMITVRAAPQEVALAPGTGRVTASECVPGQRLASGQAVLQVDGVPVVGLALRTPLWRDLTRGDTGSDVLGFTRELVRVGRLSGKPHATMTREDVEAFAAMMVEFGMPEAAVSTWTVPRSSVMWLADVSPLVASCEVGVGAPVASDQVVVAFAPRLVEARVQSELAFLPAAARVLTLGGTQIEVPGGGVITDEEQLALLAKGAAAQYDSGIESPTLAGWLRLAVSVELWAVPPAALIAAGPERGCVVWEGTSWSVHVVASELGQALVVFDHDAPPSVDLNPPKDTEC